MSIGVPFSVYNVSKGYPFDVRFDMRLGHHWESQVIGWFRSRWPVAVLGKTQPRTQPKHSSRTKAASNEVDYALVLLS